MRFLALTLLVSHLGALGVGVGIHSPATWAEEATCGPSVHAVAETAAGQQHGCEQCDMADCEAMLGCAGAGIGLLEDRLRRVQSLASGFQHISAVVFLTGRFGERILPPPRV